MVTRSPSTKLNNKETNNITKLIVNRKGFTRKNNNDNSYMN